ncbi:MAG: serine/threonine protein kinase [Streptosporangiaceae bacterium]|nr:serine/threonine protein kinase [Streptosporangiaceae bacterium]
MPDAARLEPGDPTSLGDFEVVGRLGAGGQGAVYLGRAPGGDFVAIKLLHAQMSSDPSARARFIREVTAAQKVAPFCTAKVLESDVQGDQPYIVSEFIDGPSLHDVVVLKGPFGRTDLERLAIGTVTALAAIHEAGIVHRDFKPNNVLLAADGPRVVDFGIARTVNSQESSVTATGMVVGTPGYLAPEQLTGVPLMPSVDIFAWAATMMFAATGQSPFEADTLPVIINRILNHDPDLSALHGPLREVVRRCLSKDPRLRPPAHQLLLELLGHAGAAPGPAPDREDLLDQGTRIAAQMPAPPPITPNPPPAMPGPSTPPPMPRYHGPVTPSPMPMHHGSVTPPPMRMHHGPMTPPPMHRPPGPPPYGPPPRRSSATGPVIAGVGCLVVALLVVLAVAVAVAANRHDSTPAYTSSPYTPYKPYRPYTPAPSSSYTPFGSRALNSNFHGTWKGTRSSTGSDKGSRVTITLTGGLLTGRVEYEGCSGILAVESTNSYKTVLRETVFSTGSRTCPITASVTLTYRSSTSLRYEWRRSSTDPSPSLTGTLAKS